MPPTTSLVDITPSEKKSSISVWTELENSPTTVPVFKDSWYSTQSEEELDLVWDLCYWKDYQSITARNPNSASPSIPHLKSQPLSLNLITPSSPPTPSWSTPMSPLCLITKPFTTSAEEIWISKDPLILT